GIVKSNEIADLVLVKTGSGEQLDRVIIRNSSPIDWKAVLEKNVPPLETKQIGDRKYLAVRDPEHKLPGRGPFGSVYYLPDDRRLISGTEEAIQKIARGGEPRFDVSAFPALKDSPLAVRMETSLLRDMGALDTKRNFEANPVMALFLPLFEQTKVTTLAAKVSSTDGKDVAGFAPSVESASPEGAPPAAQTFQAAATVPPNTLTAQKKDP